MAGFFYNESTKKMAISKLHATLALPVAVAKIVHPSQQHCAHCDLLDRYSEVLAPL